MDVVTITASFAHPMPLLWHLIKQSFRKALKIGCICFNDIKHLCAILFVYNNFYAIHRFDYIGASEKNENWITLFNTFYIYFLHYIKIV